MVARSVFQEVDGDRTVGVGDRADVVDVLDGARWGVGGHCREAERHCGRQHQSESELLHHRSLRFLPNRHGRRSRCGCAASERGRHAAFTPPRSDGSEPQDERFRRVRGVTRRSCLEAHPTEVSIVCVGRCFGSQFGDAEITEDASLVAVEPAAEP